MYFTAEPAPNHRLPLYKTILCVTCALLLVLNGFSLYHNLQSLKGTNALLSQSARVADRLQYLNVLVLDAESSVRGYFISGSETYLGPSKTAATEIDTELNELQALLDYLHRHDLIELQENYVATFDRNRSHAMYIFEHVYGEDRGRGMAMVDLLEEYKSEGFSLNSNELPDYLPVLLEFFAQIDAEKARRLLGDAVHVIAHIGNKLEANGSPYAALMRGITAMSPVAPQPLIEPPVRDMDEAMETFGPDVSGTEPLLKPTVDTVKFYPKDAYRAAQGV